MADNYLEKKMEELRSGRLDQTFRSGESAYRRTGMNFPFPPKRVLMASELPIQDSVINLFLKTGSKVARISEGHSADSRIREYGIDNIEESFQDILKSWRDIDILIADKEKVEVLIPVWIKHREKYRYVSDYRCRIIIFGEDEASDWVDIRLKLKSTVNWIEDRKPKGEEKTECSGGREESRPYIEEDTGKKKNPETRDISGLIGMIVLQVNAFIDGMTFKI